MDLLDMVQWPAMVVSIVAAWSVASAIRRRREQGFWWFLASNVLWVIWGWHTGAWALIGLQFALAIMNVRGTQRNSTGKNDPGKTIA